MKAKADLLNLIDAMAIAVIEYHTHQLPSSGLSPKEFEISLNDNLNEMICLCPAINSMPIRWAIAHVYSAHHFLLTSPKLTELTESVFMSFDRVFQITHEAREAWNIKRQTDD